MIAARLLFAVSLTVLAAATSAIFTDRTISSGVKFKHEASPTSQKYLIETMGGGVAVFDANNDGRLDLFFTNGAALADPMTAGKLPDKTDPKHWNRFYRQLPDGTFADETEKANLTGAGQGVYTMGVAAGDFDNDGYADLYVTGYGGNTLYRNNGNGTFTDVTAKAGTRAQGWSTSAAFLDYDNDGLLDLFVGRYVEWSFATNRYCGDAKPGARAYCHPDNFKPVSNLLFHNNSDGTFTDVSKAAGIAGALGKTLGVSVADYDGDGWPDVFAANDSVQCQLFRNKRNGTFEEVSLLAGAGFNEDGKVFAGMGTDFADYDNDGWPDIVVTDLSDERYVLFRNNRDGTFTDATSSSGLGRATLPYSGWSTKFLDYDNDGWKDLFVAQGHVMDTIELTTPNRKYLQPALLLRNKNGTLTPAEAAGSAFTQPWAGRGAAIGDLDNDGDIDIAVSNVNQKAYILRNEVGNRNRWLGIQLTGVRSNRDALGARIRVVSSSGVEQHFTVQTAGGYQSASDKRVIVGLGSSESARLIEIRWPSGLVQKLENEKAGRFLTVREPAPKR
jgi:hypothetical protein